MKVTKFGHCCLLIEIAGKRILTDPGNFSVSQNLVNDIDIILISHEHSDHLHSESVAEIIKNNPEVKIITNSSVGAILSNLDIAYQVLEGEDKLSESGILLEAYDGKHEEIFEDYGQVQNTGYFIEEKLFYPGDAYTEPGKPVPVLALPVSGPWCKTVDAISYAIRVNPRTTFPVHDGLLNSSGQEIVHRIIESQLKEKGIDFVKMKEGDSKDFS